MIDLESFTPLVHDAYAHLYDRAALVDHPLARQLFGSATETSADRLHRTLIDALDWLHPLGTENRQQAAWRRYRHLQLRYVEGATPEQIARELGISPRQARRDHAAGLDELARLLWQRISPAGKAGSSAVAARAPSFDVELAKVLAATTTTANRVDDLLQGVVETVRRLAEENRVELRLRVAPDLPVVETNRPVLRELLLTLVAKAIVQNPGVALDLSASLGEGVIDLALRGDAAVARKSSLVGPGCLEIIARLAQGLRETVESVGPRPKDGTGPEVCLRLKAPEARTLLLVDDNPDVVLLYRRFLADVPFRLVQARSGERALRLARELRPDVIVLDVLLPSIDGWEVLQALRGDAATADIPVIVSSVLPDHALAYSLGVSDFLPKPVTRDAVLAALARLPPRERAGRPRCSSEATAETRPGESRPLD